MKAFTLNSKFQSSKVFDYKGGAAAMPIAVSDDEEVVKLLKSKFKEVENNIPYNVIQEMKQALHNDELLKANELVERYTGKKSCCQAALEQIINEL